MVLELTFQRASVHPVHDAKRLEDGKDLNDALLDFFVKLGQATIPGSDGPPPVAYLGSHFYDVLRKGGMKNGREGHKNVANWARRRLGKDGLFGDGIGALAVPVNEVLRDSYEGRTDGQEKHWWLALLLNPRGAAATPNGDPSEDVSLLCLDSFVRAETRFEPPIKAHKAGGTMESYPVEVSALSRIGFCVNVSFCAKGDGTAGPLAEPWKARLKAGGREFMNRELDMKENERGSDGLPGRLEGALTFRLDRRGAAKTGGEYVLDYGEGDDYQPQLRLRMGEKPTAFQAEVAHFLSGYLAREHEVATGKLEASSEPELPGNGILEREICLPGVPQQETSHDCGYFILEMILRALQLSPEALRELATASSVEIAMLPWPSQKQVLRRKSMLRDILEALLAAAGKHGTGEVEALFRADVALRERVRTGLLEGPNFSHGYDRWAAGDWDLSASPSRSRSRSRATKPRAKAVQSSLSSDGSSVDNRRSKRRKKGRRRSTSSSAGYRRRRRSASRSRTARRVPEPPPPPPRPTFTVPDIEMLPASQLRMLCMQYNVMPPGAVERGDLLRALAPLAAPAQREATPAKAPSPTVAPNKTFTKGDLDAMPSKALRALCAQRGVLPSGLVERGDLLAALAPLAALG